MWKDLNARGGEPLTCEVTEHIGTLSADRSYSKELNMVSWRNCTPNYDLRGWRLYNGEKVPLKGITMNEDEVRELYALLKERFEGHE